MTSAPALPRRLAYIDATAGVAGDMLLAALVDAGAELDGVQRVLDALVPGSVRFTRTVVDRGGQRALKVDVEVLVEDPPHRTWASIRDMLEQARGDEAVPGRTIDLALAVFGRLADAEGATHGVPADEVHFHEVGALDSLADVIGACEAWRQLGITEGAASVIAVGSGRIRAAHGDIPVPVPAVARLAVGWPTVAGEILPPRGHAHPHSHGHGDAHTHTHTHDHPHGHEHTPHEHPAPVPGSDAELPAHMQGGPHEHGGRRVPGGVAPGIGELATPTGVALVRGLAATAGPQPAMTLAALGVGAGTKDTPGRPNVVRVLLGETAADAHATPTAAVQLEANVDDLDPRLWPGTIDALLDAGALDAWTTPIVMKRGRPATTLHVLARTEDREAIAELVMDRTGSLGVRSHHVERIIRRRAFTEVTVEGRRIAVKIAHAPDGAVVRREPEFRDVAAAAVALGISEREMLSRARAAAEALRG
ncbi:TIGR00299 family protein [Brachybacterium sp. SGAir0954]|uniref:LarC family nickel insertion protein n=1 Tax=Brachybacterium sp. SGAir0954 TaxID=2571029 RepID=UPI0010CD10F8|nr:LarC family nickel insertion protein [Brachybacterium sp. SGAir0954]QCR52646.1 TIGR00299 family protein [Brachybacterium sp. SGAir0954]